MVDQIEIVSKKNVILNLIQQITNKWKRNEFCCAP